LFFIQAEDGIRDYKVTGVQTCALPISRAFASTFFSGGANVLVPFTASKRVSESVKARSALPSRMSFILSTDAVVDCALAAVPSRSEERRVGKRCRRQRERDTWHMRASD